MSRLGSLMGEDFDAFVSALGIGLLILVVGFFCCDEIKGRWQTAQPAVIVERSHVSERTSTQVGWVYDSKGRASTVISTSTTPEEWSVVFKVGGRVVSEHTNPQTWAACTSDRRVRVAWKKGRFTSINYGWRIDASNDW